MLDSLVRVSRRVDEPNFVIIVIIQTDKPNRSSNTHQQCIAPVTQWHHSIQPSTQGVLWLPRSTISDPCTTITGPERPYLSHTFLTYTQTDDDHIKPSKSHTFIHVIHHGFAHMINGWIMRNSSLTQRMTWVQRFPLSNFKYCLTLFSKFFSSFPHGTCSLSVSRVYLALDEPYHPFRAAFPNNSTRWGCVVRGQSCLNNGVLTLFDDQFHGTWRHVTRWQHLIRIHVEDSVSTPLTHWAIPASLAVTKGILVSFLSSPY